MLLSLNFSIMSFRSTSKLTCLASSSVFGLDPAAFSFCERSNAACNVRGKATTLRGKRIDEEIKDRREGVANNTLVIDVWERTGS